MLEQIALENVGVIRRAQVEFAAGLTVITGETGAGKTMLLTGLQLLMGGKADPRVIRTGEHRAVVEGSWLLPVLRQAAADEGAGTETDVGASAQPAARAAAALALVTEAGGQQDDDGTVVAARIVTENRSKAHLGGRTVPQNVLAQFSSELVTVHGQSDQARLRTSRKQREALDTYAGAEHLHQLANYQRLRHERDAAQAELDKLLRDRQVRRQEAEMLRHGLAEIEKLAPQPGESDFLNAQISKLANVEQLRHAAGLAHQQLAGAGDFGDEPGAVELVTTAARALTAVCDADVKLGELAQRLADLGYLLADVGAELASYSDTLEADPAALDAAQQRRAQFQALERIYGDLFDWQAQAEQRLAEVEDDDSRIALLQSALDSFEADLRAAAATLSTRRQIAAEQLSQAVTAELRGLAMADAVLEIELTPTELGPYGGDEVTFLLTPHSGAVPQPLAKGASGGELSRVMLAVEVALAAGAAATTQQEGTAAEVPSTLGSLPTFVFDEVDAGVGGAAAVEVGSRLARLAKATQVIVVTHMPQVAAFGDQHVVVQKATSGDQTETRVAAVTGDERVTELARMLSGKSDSQVARRHATELLVESRVE